MEKEIISEGLQSLRDEFVALRAELRIEMITMKERLRRIDERLADNPPPIENPRRLLHIKNCADYSSADINQLSERLGICEQSVRVRIERLGKSLATLSGHATIPEDELSPHKKLDLAEAQMLNMLTFETLS